MKEPKFSLLASLSHYGPPVRKIINSLWKNEAPAKAASVKNNRIVYDLSSRSISIPLLALCPLSNLLEEATVLYEGYLEWVS
jgi:hypothetical protein